MKELEEQLTHLLAEVESYNNKPNKSKSKRIRTGLGALKKQVTGLRSSLIAADNAGY